jgi:hypothetical protein
MVLFCPGERFCARSLPVRLLGRTSKHRAAQVRVEIPKGFPLPCEPAHWRSRVKCPFWSMIDRVPVCICTCAPHMVRAPNATPALYGSSHIVPPNEWHKGATRPHTHQPVLRMLIAGDHATGVKTVFVTHCPQWECPPPPQTQSDRQ